METSLVNIDRDLLVIPNLAIHMNRDINQGYAYNPQVDLLPIFSDNKEKTLRSLVAEKLAVNEEQILSEELYLYVRQKGCLLGEDSQWILSPRLDDLQCVYASLTGICTAQPKHRIAVSVFFDNEEVGSSTRQGADSTFLEQTIERIGRALLLGQDKREELLSQSFLISADNAHALHPNHPEKADLTNQPKLNGGIVIKYHGGQKYTTDGYSAAYLTRLCKKAEVPLQTYCNRSDIAGGSTLGNIVMAHLSVPSVDIGFAQLAMHAAVETAGKEDVFYGIRLFQEYWRS
jgi:aspartyl aminopeptidase